MPDVADFLDVSFTKFEISSACWTNLRSLFVVVLVVVCLFPCFVYTCGRFIHLYYNLQTVPITVN